MAYVGNTPFGPSCPAPTRVFAQVNTGFRSVRRSVGLAHDPTSQETPASARPRVTETELTTWREFITISRPAPDGVLGPNCDVNATSSLSSVQVTSCSGSAVGLSPRSPPQLRIRPGTRLMPATAT